MNERLGLYSSIALTISTVVFLYSMIIESLSLLYFSSIILSWSFVIFISSMLQFCVLERKAYGYSATLFAIIYACIINIIYFAKLSTFKYENVNNLLDDNLDLQGYGFMAISTFFLGITIIPYNKNEMYLKTLLLIHGIFVIFCIMFPTFNVLKMFESNDLNKNIILIFWSIYFIPIGFLSIIYFNRLIPKIKRNSIKR
jgi:hypothetical protein